MSTSRWWRATHFQNCNSTTNCPSREGRYRPTLWYCAFSSCRVRAIVVECARRSNIPYPSPEVHIRKVILIAQFYAIEAGTTLEHRLVAVTFKFCCWQFRSSCQGCAMVEHVAVAAISISKGRCRQCRSSLQGSAVGEHAAIAVEIKCRGWKCWRSSQGCAIVEHAAVAVVSKCLRWQCRSRCQGRAILEHVGVAAAVKSRCWQGRSRCQGCAIGEHAVVAVFGKGRSRKCWSGCQGTAL